MAAVIGNLFGSIFFLMFFAPFVLAIVGMVYRTRAARRIAIRAGMNEQDAAATALWGSPGLDTTYLAANLRAPAPTVPMGPPRPVPPKTIEDRLRELERLKAEGLVTQGEYDAQRKAIVGSV